MSCSYFSAPGPPEPLKSFEFFVLFGSWANLGRPWGQLGAILGHLGTSWTLYLEAILAPLGANLGPSWAILGQLGSILGPTWAILGPSWGQRPKKGDSQSISPADRGHFWTPLGAHIGLCWASRALLRRLEAIYVRNRKCPFYIVNYNAKSPSGGLQDSQVGVLLTPSSHLGSI